MWSNVSETEVKIEICCRFKKMKIYYFVSEDNIRKGELINFIITVKQANICIKVL